MGNADLEIALKSAEGIVNQGLNYLRKKTVPNKTKVFLYVLAHALAQALSIAASFLRICREKGDNEKLLG